MSEDTPESGELRGKLLKRLVVAGGLVAVLLAVLAFFDHLASAPEEPETPVYSQPVPVPPKKEMTQPVKGGEPAVWGFLKDAKYEGEKVFKKRKFDVWGIQKGHGCVLWLFVSCSLSLSSRHSKRSVGGCRRAVNARSSASLPTT